MSREAQVVTRKAGHLISTMERSQALFGKKSAAISQLNAVADECSEEDWDGCGANAVNTLALHFAECLVRALPDDIPLPEFAPEPDGSISLDWIRSRTRLFSVSVGKNQRLAYAWLDGSDRGYAVEHFNGEKVPFRILDGIRTVMNGR